MKNESSFRILTACIVIFGIAAVSIAGACGYYYLASAASARAFQAEQDNLEHAQQFLSEVAGIQAEARELAASIARHPASWAWSEQFPIMVAQITEIADDSGVTLETLQPAPVVERQQLHVKRFPLRLTLQADLASLTRFLQKVRQSAPLLAVDQLTIRAGETAGDPLRIDVLLSSYTIMDGRGAEGKQR